MKKYVLFTVVVVVLVSLLIYFQSGKEGVKKQSLTIKGSDTEVQLVSNLAEAFTAKNTDVEITVTGGGSGTGIAALLNKEIDLANSSRVLSQEEWDQAKNKDIDTREFILARDGLSIIVHPSNLLTNISMDAISKIYSGKIKSWSELGGPSESIVLYGRQSTSGTYVFFRDTAVKDDYDQGMRNLEGNQAITDAVKSDRNGIGYVGVGYAKDDKGNPRSDIKAISILDDKGLSISPFDEEAVKSGKYPVTRKIYQYTNTDPKNNSGLLEFLKFESSDEGQSIIKSSGFYGLTSEDVINNEKVIK